MSIKSDFIKSNPTSMLFFVRGAEIRLAPAAKLGDAGVVSNGIAYFFTNIWCITGPVEALIDWQLVPVEILENLPRHRVLLEYLNRVKGARMLDDRHSVGAVFIPQMLPAQTGRKLPNGWRVIEGGAR